MADPKKHGPDGACKIMLCPGCNPMQFQDLKYGNGMRVHNPGKDSFHCTVCGGKKPY